MITRRSWRALVRVAALTMAFALTLGCTAAYAEISGLVSAESSTNPDTGVHQPTGLKQEFRAGWGKWAPVSFQTVSTPTDAEGFLYLIDRDEFSVIDTLTPSAYLRSSNRLGSHFFKEFDIAGTLSFNPSFDGTVLYPGQATKPIEGPWVVHTVFYEVQQPNLKYNYSDVQQDWFFGIDQTPPSTPTGLQAFRAAEATQPIAGGVVPQGRIHLRWNVQEYDKLSGTAIFNVYVDGKLKLGWKETLTEPSDGIPWFGADAPSGVTLENLGAGRHTVQIAALDRATNESVKSTALTVFVDPDDPVVTITNPSAGGKLGVKPTVKATIKDLGGVKAVGFKVDSSNMGTITPSTVTTNYAAAKTLDLSAFANGGHTLTVTGLDMAGRTVTKAVSFTLDKSAPSMSITSKGPNPFYPRKREGYKDNYVVKFNTNEAGTAYLDIYSGGKLYRSVKKSMVSGANSISWDGKSSSGALKASSYSVKLRLVDAAGNTRTSSSFGATIRFYEVVVTSSGSARVIER